MGFFVVNEKLTFPETNGIIPDILGLTSKTLESLSCFGIYPWLTQSNDSALITCHSSIGLARRSRNPTGIDTRSPCCQMQSNYWKALYRHAENAIL